MRTFLRAILLASALSAAGIATNTLAASPVAPVLTTPDARDVRSYARPLVARVTHVDLDLTADFDTKTMSGQAAMDVLAAPGAKEIVLDTLGLTVSKVTDGAGRDLAWKLGASDAELGAPLTVQLNGAKRIVVHYAPALARARFSGCRRH